MERVQIIDKIKEVYMIKPEIFQLDRYNKDDSEYIELEIKYKYFDSYKEFINSQVYEYRWCLIDLNDIEINDIKGLYKFKRFAQYMNSIENKY